jgi:hypothetical protein
MRLHALPFALSLLAVTTAGNDAFAQGTPNRVRTESYRPTPLAPVQPASPQIHTDLSQLPAPVARTRTRLLEAARSGDLNKLLTAMQMHETPPVFSFGKERDPVAFWQAAYPDSAGIEVLSILITLLETGYVHVDQGTPQEMYIWPYFVRVPLKTLDAEQKVELFRIITGGDYKGMVEAGAYTFYRVGIAPDGVWHFFVSGNQANAGSATGPGTRKP